MTETPKEHVTELLYYIKDISLKVDKLVNHGICNNSAFSKTDVLMMVYHYNEGIMSAIKKYESLYCPIKEKEDDNNK